jgi:hypothetical protein
MFRRYKPAILGLRPYMKHSSKTMSTALSHWEYLHCMIGDIKIKNYS